MFVFFLFNTLHMFNLFLNFEFLLKCGFTELIGVRQNMISDIGGRGLSYFFFFFLTRRERGEANFRFFAVSYGDDPT